MTEHMKRPDSGTVSVLEIRKIEIDGNHRKKITKASIEELAASMKADGQLQPILVRAMNTTPVTYTLAAGERRLRAAMHLKWAFVDAVIRLMTDAEFERFQLVENIHHERLVPLDEADGFHKCLTVGKLTMNELVEQTGKSPSYVYQRMQLRNLCKQAKAEVRAGVLPLGPAIRIARLTPHDQPEALKLYRQLGGQGLTRFDEDLERTYMLKMSMANFPLDDAELIKGVPACTECPKRTGNATELFPEYAKADTCTDRKCFDVKQVEAARRKVKDLGERKIDHVQVTTAWHLIDKIPGVLTKEMYREVQPKDCKHATPAVIVHAGHPGDSARIGKMIHVCTSPKCSVHKRDQGVPTTGMSDKEKAKRKAERQAAARVQDFRQQVFYGIMDSILDVKTFSADDKLGDKVRNLISRKTFGRVYYDGQKRLCQLLGWPIQYYTDGDAKSGFDAKKTAHGEIEKLDAVETFRFLLACALSGEIDQTPHLSDADDLFDVAAQLGIDVDKEQEEYDAERDAEEKAKAERKAERTRRAKKSKGKGKAKAEAKA